MSKPPEFYKRYVNAVFKRGKAERLPLQYFIQEGERVLTPDELKLFLAEIEAMVDKGEIRRDEQSMLQLVSQC